MSFFPFTFMYRIFSYFHLHSLIAEMIYVQKKKFTVVIKKRSVKEIYDGDWCNVYEVQEHNFVREQPSVNVIYESAFTTAARTFNHALNWNANKHKLMRWILSRVLL